MEEKKWIMIEHLMYSKLRGTVSIYTVGPNQKVQAVNKICLIDLLVWVVVKIGPTFNPPPKKAANINCKYLAKYKCV